MTQQVALAASGSISSLEETGVVHHAVTRVYQHHSEILIQVKRSKLRMPDTRNTTSINVNKRLNLARTAILTSTQMGAEEVLVGRAQDCALM